MEKKIHWIDLDGVRGVLALLVVFLHFGIGSLVERELHAPPLRLDLAVDVFFLLSGFVLTHSVRDGVDPPIFLAKRIFRLIPVYFVTTLMTLVFLGSVPEKMWAEIALAWSFAGRSPVNFPAWSIAWEFYLPTLVVFVPIRIPQKLVRPALVASLGLLGVCDVIVARGAHIYAARALLGLLAGYLLYKSDLPAPKKITFDVIALCVVSCIIICGAAPFLAFALPLLASAAILAGRRGGMLFRTAPARWLGTISYTLYLAHIPVLRFFQAVYGESALDSPAVKFAAVALALVSATLLTAAVERPMMNVSNRLFKKEVVISESPSV